MEPRLSLITLGVADLARSRRFYEQGLGWRPSSAGDGENVAFYQLGGVALALFGRAALAADAKVTDDGGRFGAITLAQNQRTREDVDAVVERARAAGAEVVKPPEEVFWGGYSGYFRDPDGHLWEIAWNPFFELLPGGDLKLPD